MPFPFSQCMSLFLTNFVILFNGAHKIESARFLKIKGENAGCSLLTTHSKTLRKWSEHLPQNGLGRARCNREAEFLGLGALAIPQEELLGDNGCASKKVFHSSNF